MYNILTPDPENDPDEEAELTYRLQEAMHEYEPDIDGMCAAEVRKFCYEHKRVDYHNRCGAQESSVLHYYEPSCSCDDYHFCGNPNHA